MFTEIVARASYTGRFSIAGRTGTIAMPDVKAIVFVVDDDISVRESVPDSVLDAADEIELIVLTPELLRTRPAEGKVYFGERAATAAENRRNPARC